MPDAKDNIRKKSEAKKAETETEKKQEAPKVSDEKTAREKAKEAAEAKTAFEGYIAARQRSDDVADFQQAADADKHNQNIFIILSSNDELPASITQEMLIKWYTFILRDHSHEKQNKYISVIKN